ncbi:MAG TPA: preprotein translocase subunit YajC [Acidimicrobiales bacterium]|nr:preprotein translocase subunit YajC [Acidimicrobiales bacterium]
MGGLILLVLLAVMWAVLIIPQQRRLKRQRELVASIKVGDDVMIAAGIYGTVTGEDDDDLFLEIAPAVEIRVSRAAVAQRVEFEDVDDTETGRSDS